MHHVLGIEVELAALLLLPTGLVAIPAPRPIVLVVGKRLPPALFVVEKETGKTSGLVFLRYRLASDHVASENSTGLLAVVIKTIRVAAVLQSRGMILV